MEQRQHIHNRFHLNMSSLELLKLSRYSNNNSVFVWIEKTFDQLITSNSCSRSRSIHRIPAIRWRRPTFRYWRVYYPAAEMPPNVNCAIVAIMAFTRQNWRRYEICMRLMHGALQRWRIGVVVNALVSINVVNRHQVRLLLGSVTGDR